MTDYTDNQQEVIIAYGEEVLDAYQKVFNLSSTDVKYDKFIKSYYGKFDSTKQFTINYGEVNYQEYDYHFFRVI